MINMDENRRVRIDYFFVFDIIVLWRIEMSNLELMWNLEKINSIIETIKIFFIIHFTIYFFCRMINIKHIKNSYFFIKNVHH